MKDERRRILEMLSSGKITVEEAERLLEAVSSGAGDHTERGAGKPRYLHIVVEPDPANGGGERVNIRVPLKLIRAGLKLASFIPKGARSQVHQALLEKGIDVDFSNVKPEDMDELVEQLKQLTVDVEGKEKVRIFCE
jgi:hypothetical protein